MSEAHWRTLRVATYNIHRCRGLDGRTNPTRVAEVIRDIDADVVALQEVIGASQTSPGHAEELGALLGMGWVMAPARHLRGALFGNVVMSRLPIRQHSQYDLTWRTCEPRCCQRVDIEIGNDTLHLYNVHLGTALLERRHQAGRLSAILHDRRVGVPKVVLGDFNEWMRGMATEMLTERLKSIDLRAHLRRRHTYPGVFPVLHLDHIYYEGNVEVVKLELPRTRRSLMASDHLPLIAELRVQFS
ncbi:MAG TPA: endonuclease/exonuclease/phosphatase family protein [Vicinamibacterales bacterium]|nr:endonuclease/exonuclease/phosphatase family protein [Vicinamibacterales bacterium]